MTFARSRSLALVDAHLKSNFAYFGSLDKTLSGFFVLDSEGDDYTLFDLREPKGQVWFLDHDELELTPRFESLEAYQRWRDQADQARRKGDETLSLPRPIKDRSKRKPATARLWRRFRWLVWLLSQPKQVSEDDAVSTAVEAFTRHERADYERVFRAELGLLGGDPNLAVYWLLHFTVLADDASRATVVAAVARSKNPWVREFVDVFGQLGPAANLRVLPPFRERRARFVFETAATHAADEFAAVLQACRIAPTLGLRMAQALWAAAPAEPQRAQVRALVAEKRKGGPGVEYLLAELARLDGAPVKADWLLEHDPYSTRFLELAFAGARSPALEKRLADSRQVDAVLEGVLRAVRTNAKKAQTMADVDRLVKPALGAFARAPATVRELAARRIIANAADYPNAALLTAFATVKALVGSKTERTALLTQAAMAMWSYDPVKAAVARAKAGDAEARELLAALLLFDERRCNDAHALYVKEFAIEGLGASVAKEPTFTALLEHLCRPGFARLTSVMLQTALAPRGPASVLPKLTPAQKVALALALTRSPPPKNSVYDRSGDVLEAVFSVPLHRQVKAALK